MILKGNRQIGLDGRIFINDCLSDGLFFVYSIILSGILGAVGDVLKLTGKSSFVMDPLTNGLILMDFACCLGLVLVSYYVYFMNCGESMPKLGVKPLVYLEYVRLAYYGMLIYDVLYRFCDEILHSGKYPIAMSVFYVAYLGWLISCSFAAMFIAESERAWSCIARRTSPSISSPSRSWRFRQRHAMATTRSNRPAVAR